MSSVKKNNSYQGKPTDGKGKQTWDTIQDTLHLVDSAVTLIQKIGEERRKTEEVRLKSKKMDNDLKLKIIQTENETRRILGNYRVEMEKIAKEVRLAEVAAEQRIAEGHDLHEERMENMKHIHEERMKVLDMFDKIIDRTLLLYTQYQSCAYSSMEDGAVIVNLDALSAMETLLQQMNVTMTQALQGMPSTRYLGPGETKK